MWGNLGDRLAGLGDALTQQASAHAKRQHDQQDQNNTINNDGSASNVTTSESSSSSGAPPPEAVEDTASFAPVNETEAGQQQQQQQVPFGSRWASIQNPLASLTSSIQQQPHQQAQSQSQLQQQQSAAMLGSFRNWTGSVMEATKHLADATRETLEKEQARIQASAPSLFSKQNLHRPHRRDPSLPLDVEALRDAEVVYITDRIVTLSHPYMQSTTDGDITPDRKLAAVGQLLQKRHGGRYMVWNLSEVEYDANLLDDQVLVYKFPGSPSPPLGLLLKLLMSMESWLKADERNVAVMHCLTGRGRTSTVLAAFLCWTGEAGFSDVNVALEYIARCKRIGVEALTIPSQVRYVSYFANMLDGVRPSQPPLMLKRIIMSEAPKFGKRPVPTNDNTDGSEEAPPTEALLGCAPYLQVFKGGTLIFTTAASMNYAQTKDDLPFCTTADGPVSFLTEAVVQGDILLRCRHLTRSGQRVSMFRCAFHTGYVPPKVLRLTKAQLDGACSDKRFSEDFFLDLIFEPCDEATASKHLMENSEKASSGGGADTAAGAEDGGEEGAANEAAERRSMGTVAYDSMLHRDSRFWDVIAARREENRQKMAALEKKEVAPESEGDKEDANTPLFGPTIGRRRDFTALKRSDSAADAGTAGEDAARTDVKSAKKPQNPMSAFSIGGDFDFGSDSTPKPPTSSEEPNKVPISPPTPKPKQRDELMEALMDLEDDGLDGDDEHEHAIPPPPITHDEMEGEIVFESESATEEVKEDAFTTASPQPDTAADASNDNGAAPTDVADTASPTEEDTAPTTDANNDSIENNTPTAPAEEAIELPEPTTDNENILSSIAGLDDELADLDVEDTNEDHDILGDDDDFNFDDDLEDDAELEDLENFLTQVSKK